MLGTECVYKIISKFVLEKHDTHTSRRWVSVYKSYQKKKDGLMFAVLVVNDAIKDEDF